MPAVEVTVPGGYDDHGRWCRTLRVRPWCGQDEAVLLEELAGATPAARATQLLARCLSSDRGPSAEDVALARSLSLGDREALLLHLRRITLGDRLSCVLACPACGARLDLDLRVADLLVPPYGHESVEHEARLPSDGETMRIRFRLPNGGDQEAAARVFEEKDEAAAVRLLVARCVRRADVDEGVPLGGLPDDLIPSLSEAIAERDPQAEIELDAVCPDCGRSFAVPFDCARYIQDEMAQGADALYREVHALAWHYHWSESDILAMTGRQRRRYLSLIAEQRAAGRTS
jgi:hypothetical protein